jgi:hypothetical protein
VTEWDGTFEGFMATNRPHYNALSSARPQLLEGEPGEHVWVLMAVYRVDTTRLVTKTDPLIMDGENLASAEVGCWVCGTHWSERRDDRECPGSPAEQLKRALLNMLTCPPPCTGCDSPLCPDCGGKAA